MEGHATWCPRLKDPSCTCVCRFRRPALAYVTREQAVDLWGEWHVARLTREGLLRRVSGGYVVYADDLAAQAKARR